MLIKRSPDIRSSEITDRKLYLNRREFISAAAVTTAAVTMGALGTESVLQAATPAPHGRKLENVKKSAFGTDEKPNKWEEITTYNNYYEFGIDKDSPSMFARNLKTEPWTVAIDGECGKKGNMPLEDILKGQALEERIYRHRCVEAWSMVIPWVGFPLADLIKKCEPTSKAKFVEFTTFFDPKQMSARTSSIRYPYVEGLRLDEAMHPLTIMAVGLYGEVIPNQDGAPMRLVVPWKYGFKHIKSIARIRFVDGASHRRIPAAQDIDVQWLWRSGGEPLHGHGLEEELLGSSKQRIREQGSGRCRIARFGSASSRLSSSPL